MPMLSICLDERSYAALQRCAADRGRSAEDLAEAAVSDAAIQNDPQSEPPRMPPLPLRPQPPRTPEDGQRPQTHEDGRPVHTR